MSVTLVADTNFLIYLLKQRIADLLEDRFPGFSLSLPSQVLNELSSVARRARKLSNRKAATLAREYLKKLKGEKRLSVRRIKAKTADEAIALLAKKLRAPVCTNDKTFLKRLKSHGLSVITVRQKRKLGYA